MATVEEKGDSVQTPQVSTGGCCGSTGGCCGEPAQAQQVRIPVAAVSGCGEPTQKSDK